VDDREVKMAQHLIDSLSGDFKPEKYHDEYRERVMEMLEQKAKGEEIVTQPPIAEKPHRVINLMAALEASLAEAKKQKRRNGHAHAAAEPRRRKSA
jgi:DNA end-binding protein Ku